MARIDAKRSGITTNIPESVLRGLKSPALGFSWRYRDSSGFSFSADSHFYFSPFHFRLLLRRLYNTSLAARPYFVFARGGRRKVGSSRMCKFHTSRRPMKLLLHHFSAVKWCSSDFIGRREVWNLHILLDPIFFRPHARRQSRV